MQQARIDQVSPVQSPHWEDLVDSSGSHAAVLTDSLDLCTSTHLRSLRDDPCPNAPFFHVVDIGQRQRRAFFRGERIFFHLRLSGSQRADIVLRDPTGLVVHESRGHYLTNDGELLMASQVPRGARVGWYRIDITLDSLLQVYQCIAICE